MRILLTGANGYIGRRLLPVLVQNGHHVVCLVRNRHRMELEESLKPHVSFFEADLLKKETLKNFPEEIDAAYYLVHSMGGSYKDFHTMEMEAAENFVQAIGKSQTKQIIYLSGIANDKNLSKHLKSRQEVEEVLKASSIATTVLRAAIIIGSGGASFEIIRDLVEKLPVMVAPKWLRTRSQPIAIHNVMQYLSGVLLHPKAMNQTFDIGGPDILTYKEMLLQFAEVRGFKRYIITVPVLTPRLSSYWLYLVTSTSFSIARSLVDSMMNEVIVKKDGIRDFLPIDLIPYKEAVAKAFDKIAQNEVVSSWKDSLVLSRHRSDMQEYLHVPKHGCFEDKRVKQFDKPAKEVLENIWSIGGDRGWYYWGFLWKIRGLLDRMVGGVGLRRGRRSPTMLVAGDALDFWRVLVADKKEKRLLLYAEMKLPGEAWLEFKIKPNEEGGHCLIQTATFRPEGLWGRLYWYSVWPFHFFIFDGMAERIIHYSTTTTSGNAISEQTTAQVQAGRGSLEKEHDLNMSQEVKS